jgi:hypothetical protein
VCLPETPSACQFAHSLWDLNVRRLSIRYAGGRTLMSPRAKSRMGTRSGDGVLARQQHRAWQSMCRSCAPSRQRRQVFRPRAVRKPRRCHAMTVSGLTMTSAARHPVQRRESMTQTHRSVVASRSRRGRGGARSGFSGRSASRSNSLTTYAATPPVLPCLCSTTTGSTSRGRRRLATWCETCWCSQAARTT